MSSFYIYDCGAETTASIHWAQPRTDVRSIWLNVDFTVTGVFVLPVGVGTDVPRRRPIMCMSRWRNIMWRDCKGFDLLVLLTVCMLMSNSDRTVPSAWPVFIFNVTTGNNNRQRDKRQQQPATTRACNHTNPRLTKSDATRLIHARTSNCKVSVISFYLKKTE